jgi:hypothetical protein
MEAAGLRDGGVLAGVSFVEGGRLTAKVNFTGLFALVAK